MDRHFRNRNESRVAKLIESLETCDRISYNRNLLRKRIVREIAPALFAIRAEPDGPELVVGSDSMRIYHESRTGEPDEAPGVQIDDGGDEYGELLGMAEEDEELSTGGPRYEPGEEEEREKEEGKRE